MRCVQGVVVTVPKLVYDYMRGRRGLACQWVFDLRYMTVNVEIVNKVILFDGT